MDSLLTALRDELGADRVSVEANDLATHGRDACPLIAKWTDAELHAHRPLCVVRPRHAGEVAATLRCARQHRVPIVPYGGGSGVVGAAVPVGPSISLDTRALEAAMEIDEVNWLVTASAGALGSDVEEKLNARGFTLGHYPQSLYLSTLGGWVATRATGTFSSKYGGIEDLIYSLEIVLPTGELIRTRHVARSSAGPRLFDLFTGAEGVFGIVTRVTLKVRPLPEARLFRGVSFPTIHDGLRAVREFYRAHLVPAVIRLYEEQEAQRLYAAAGVSSQRPLLVLGCEGLADIAETELRRLLEISRRHGGEDLGPDLGNAWEKHRFNAEWLEHGNAGAGKMADAIDVAADWENLPVLYDRLIGALRSICSTAWAHYSHFTAHGGSIYFIIFIDAPDRALALERYQRAWQTAMDHALAVGGSTSHHHGVGLLRQRFMERELGGERIVLQRIKQALDPDGILNPRKLGL